MSDVRYCKVLLLAQSQNTTNQERLVKLGQSWQYTSVV